MGGGGGKTADDAADEEVDVMAESSEDFMDQCIFSIFFLEITMAFLKFLLESLFFLRFQTKILQEEIRFISGKFKR